MKPPENRDRESPTEHRDRDRWRELQRTEIETYREQRYSDLQRTEMER